MKIRIFYTDGSDYVAKGRRAKSLLRRELEGTGLSINDILGIQRGDVLFVPDDEDQENGIVLRCFERNPDHYKKFVDCYDYSSNRRWDRFSVSVK